MDSCELNFMNWGLVTVLLIHALESAMSLKNNENLFAKNRKKIFFGYTWYVFHNKTQKKLSTYIR